jgi:predicted FMN-binding regulatory protein PaiB
MYVPSTFQYTQCYFFSNYLQRIKFGAINSATDRGKLSKAIQVPVLIFNMHRMFAAGHRGNENPSFDKGHTMQ